MILEQWIELLGITEEELADEYNAVFVEPEDEEFEDEGDEYWGDEDDDEYWDDEYWNEDEGFDPYEGCYTYDC